MLLPQVSVAYLEGDRCLALDQAYRIQMDQLVSRLNRGALDESEFEAQREEALRSYQEAAETCVRSARLPQGVAPHRPMVAAVVTTGRGPASIAETPSGYVSRHNTMYEEIHSPDEEEAEEFE